MEAVVSSNRSRWLGLIVLAVTGVLSSGCAATLDANMQTLVPGQRVRPPGNGENKVYIEFQDQTGEGAEFEQDLYEAIREKVEAKGYEVVSHDEADYVLWATLRLFGQVGREEGSKALAGLGGIEGGATTGIVVAELTENATGAWVAGIGGGAMTAYFIDKITEKDHWAMVIDVQLGRRLDEAAKQTIQVADQSRIQSATIAGVQSGIVGSVEGGGSGQSVSKSTEIVEDTIFLELEQRVIGQATSRGKSREDVAVALIDRLSNGLSSQLPRVRGDKPPKGGGEGKGGDPPK